MSFHRGALTLSDGKAQIVRELLGHQSGRSLLIGDGYSDLLAGQAVDLFVGFGGVAKRERVLTQAPVFVHSRSLAPLLILAAGPAARRWLDTAAQETVFNKGLDLIVTTGAVTFTNERFKQKFDKALHAAH
jgi:phosphoserine phosphatase